MEKKILQSINRMWNCSANGFTLYASLNLYVSSLGLVNNLNKSSKCSLWEFLLSISNRMPWSGCICSREKSSLLINSSLQRTQCLGEPSSCIRVSGCVISFPYELNDCAIGEIASSVTDNFFIGKMSNSDCSPDIVLKNLRGRKGDSEYRPTPVHKADDSSHPDNFVGIIHSLCHGCQISPSLIAAADPWCRRSLWIKMIQ